MNDVFFVMCVFDSLLFSVPAPPAARKFVAGVQRRRAALTLPVTCIAVFLFSLPVFRTQMWVSISSFGAVIAVAVLPAPGRLLDRLETPAADPASGERNVCGGRPAGPSPPEYLLAGALPHVAV
jgi:hypothetical protein